MRQRRGLSMIEVVFAVMLVVLAACFVMTLFVSGSRPQLRAQENTTLNLLAQRKMDVLMGVPFESLAASAGFFDAPYDKWKFGITLDDFDAKTKRIALRVTPPGTTSVPQTLYALRAP